MAVIHLTDAPDDGTTFGQNSSDKISFFGATPITRISLGALPANATDAATAVTLANAIKAQLVAFGLST